jgi:hypothetical protein
MVEVGRYETRKEAEFAQASLAVAGIPSTLITEDPSGGYPFETGGDARLLVEETDAEAAAVVLSRDGKPDQR